MSWLRGDDELTRAYEALAESEDDFDGYDDVEIEPFWRTRRVIPLTCGHTHMVVMNGEAKELQPVALLEQDWITGKYSGQVRVIMGFADAYGCLITLDQVPNATVGEI